MGWKADSLLSSPKASCVIGPTLVADGGAVLG